MDIIDFKEVGLSALTIGIVSPITQGHGFFNMHNGKTVLGMAGANIIGQAINNMALKKTGYVTNSMALTATDAVLSGASFVGIKYALGHDQAMKNFILALGSTLVAELIISFFLMPTITVVAETKA